MLNAIPQGPPSALLRSQNQVLKRSITNPVTGKVLASLECLEFLFKACQSEEPELFPHISCQHRCFSQADKSIKKGMAEIRYGTAVEQKAREHVPFV